MNLLDLIKAKNRCLEKFLDVTADFLDLLENCDYSKVSEFDHSRESILKAIDLYDRKISEALTAAGQAPALGPDARTQIDHALALKKRLIDSILALDSRIVHLMEGEKGRLEREIRTSQKANQTMGKFKSIPTQPGEGIDRKL